MKGYTDIEQSRKLADILPIKSADMYYPYNDIETYPEVRNGLEPETFIPCWSLAALLAVLPDVHLKKYIYDGITKYYATLIGIRQLNSEHYDSPVDACYELIVKLPELNIL